MQTEPPSGGYTCICVDGKPYFQVMRARRPDDKITAGPWKKLVECWHFELSKSEGSTTMLNLGPGTLTEDETSFIPEEDPFGRRLPGAGFMTADYTTQPPTVKLAKDHDKLSKWIVSRSEKENQWYIENVNDSGKHAWLSMARDPVAIHEVGYDGKGVCEYRPAVLSYDTKPHFKIDIAASGILDK
jgi:hypothetical protein